MAVFIPLALIVVIGGIIFFFKYDSGNVSSFLEREGFQMPSVPPQDISPEERTLVNLQPMAIKDTGFAGPYPNGSYDAAMATGKALKAGFRFLTLQIDYLDANKKDFEIPNFPTLILRSPDGALLSKNSGSIKTVAETIANMAFRPEVPNSLEPVILYLHILRAPNNVTDPNAYLKFLSNIAIALKPIAPVHLGLNPLGNFTRQKMADTLLTTPLKSLEGSVIVLTNADTSLFRSTSTSLNKFAPAEDLDFWINMRVYLEDEADSHLGISKLSDDPSAVFAVVVDFNRVTAMTDAKKDAFAAKGRKRYVIAMPPRLKNPTTLQTGDGINKLGINAIPIDIFTDSESIIKDIKSEYADMTYHPKPTVLRTIRY